jgi:hypothetical protein
VEEAARAAEGSSGPARVSALSQEGPFPTSKGTGCTPPLGPSKSSGTSTVGQGTPPRNSRIQVGGRTSVVAAQPSQAPARWPRALRRLGWLRDMHARCRLPLLPPTCRLTLTYPPATPQNITKLLNITKKLINSRCPKYLFNQLAVAIFFL